MGGMQAIHQSTDYVRGLEASTESSNSSSTSKFTGMGNIARVVLATALIVGAVALAIITGGIGGVAAGVAVGVFAGLAGGVTFGFVHMGIKKLENKSSTEIAEQSIERERSNHITEPIKTTILEEQNLLNFRGL